MSNTETQDMAKSRALLTENERDQIARMHGDERRYQATSRVRRRINEELTKDIDVLEEYHPKLLHELRQKVCEGPRLANGIEAYVAIKEHPDTGEDEILFDGGVIEHVPYTETSSDTLKWGYSGAGATNTARSILEHAIEELGFEDVKIEHDDQTNFRQEFIQRQSGSGWALPLSTVENWIQNHLSDAI